MYSTISERVYHGLRNSILVLKLEPGSEISIKLIAENLGVSRSPVRDALLELEKEGLVDILPQIGTRVSRIDIERMHEERFLRESLEEKTLALFIGKHTEADIFRLREVIERQRTCLAEGDFVSFLDNDDEFHRIFFEAADKKMCWNLVRSMSGHYRRVRLLNLRNRAVPDNILSQHAELLVHICAKNRPAAQRVMKDHLSKIFFEEKELVQEFPDYFTSEKRTDDFAFFQEAL